MNSEDDGSAADTARRRLRVVIRSRGGYERLEVRDVDGTLLGRYDNYDGHLEIEVPERSLDVAAVVEPYLMGGDQPFGEIAPRHVEAAGRLGDALMNAPFIWHRAVPMRGRLLFFYCPVARLIAEIVESTRAEDDAPDTWVREEGLQLATVPLRDVHDDLPGVVTRLNRLCLMRSESALRPPDDDEPGPGRFQRIWRALTDS